MKLKKEGYIEKVRDGEKVKELECPEGYKSVDGKCVKMSTLEKQHRIDAAKKAKRVIGTGAKKDISKRRLSTMKRFNIDSGPKENKDNMNIRDLIREEIKKILLENNSEDKLHARFLNSIKMISTELSRDLQHGVNGHLPVNKISHLKLNVVDHEKGDDIHFRLEAPFDYHFSKLVFPLMIYAEGLVSDDHIKSFEFCDVTWNGNFDTEVPLKLTEKEKEKLIYNLIASKLN